MVVFAVLIVGGLYSYSLVPAGASVQEWMGRPRNDYDRLGHFMQGFAPALRVARVRGRHLCRRRRSQLSRRAGRCVGRAMGHAVLDLHTNHGHPQRQVCACQKECVSCRVCVPIHRSSARLLLRWSSRMGCPFAWAVHSQGLSIRKAADRLGISFHTLDNWIRRGRPKRTVQVPSGPPKTLAEAAARVRSLEADVRRLTLEREILKKAAAYFAKEQS